TPRRAPPLLLYRVRRLDALTLARPRPLFAGAAGPAAARQSFLPATLHRALILRLRPRHHTWPRLRRCDADDRPLPAGRRRILPAPPPRRFRPRCWRLIDILRDPRLRRRLACRQ